MPIEFMMGGMLYSSDSKSVKSYSESQKDKESFESALKTKIAGVSIGADFSFESEKEQDNSNKQEFKNLEIKQIGGKPGSGENPEAFCDSLTFVDNWEIVDITKFYPSILLLKDVMSDENSPVFRKALRLLNNYHYIESVKKLQPYIDILDYATEIESRIDVF